MSANNQIVVIQKEDKVSVIEYDVEGDIDPRLTGMVLGTFNTLREAVDFAYEYAAENIVEYGVAIHKDLIGNRAFDI